MTSLPKFANTAELIKSLKEDETINCFCPKVLDQHVGFFKENFPGTVAYAVKANPTPNFLRSTYQGRY